MRVPLGPRTPRLVDDETVDPGDIARCVRELTKFTERYKPLLTRSDQGPHLGMYLEGLVSGLERKSIEPIANAHDVYRRSLQRFVGAGKWSDTDLRREMRRHVVEEIGSTEGVLVLDGSAFPKKGVDSVGVTRQWCGRLGKVDSCQVGIFIAYWAPQGAVLLDAEVYLPRDWVDDAGRREMTHIPPEIKYRTNWELADGMLQRIGAEIPHRWIVGDDEFGRPSRFRDRLADRRERYLLEVPCNTLVRRPPDWPGRKAKWCPVSLRRRRLPAERWERVIVRDGEKGPIEAFAFCTRVETRRRNGPPREETLLVMRSIDDAQVWYFLGSKDVELDAAGLVRVVAHRHHIEEVFAIGKGEAGLDHYEVRSWVGWHHPMTLSMLAVWFLVRERRRLEKKLPQ